MSTIRQNLNRLFRLSRLRRKKNIPLRHFIEINRPKIQYHRSWYPHEDQPNYPSVVSLALVNEFLEI